MIIIEQSAVIPYRKSAEGIIEIMLVTTRNESWTIPKGTIQIGFSARESAANEAREEAGISGKVKKKIIGEYSYKKFGDNYSVKVYKMKIKKVHKKWDEKHFRERLWVEQKSISKFIGHKNLLKIINSAFK